MKKCNWSWGEAQRLKRGPEVGKRPRGWGEAKRLRKGPEVEERPRGWGEVQRLRRGPEVEERSRGWGKDQRLRRGLEATLTHLVDVGGFAAVASSGTAGACSPCRLGVKLLNCSQCAAFLTTSVKGYHTWKWPWSSKGESACFTVICSGLHQFYNRCTCNRCTVICSGLQLHQLSLSLTWFSHLFRPKLHQFYTCNMVHIVICSGLGVHPKKKKKKKKEEEEIIH